MGRGCGVEAGVDVVHGVLVKQGTEKGAAGVDRVRGWACQQGEGVVRVSGDRSSLQGMRGTLEE